MQKRKLFALFLSVLLMLVSELKMYSCNLDILNKQQNIDHFSSSTLFSNLRRICHMFQQYFAHLMFECLLLTTLFL